MLNAYVSNIEQLITTSGVAKEADLVEAVWIDLIDPTKQEEASVESLLKVGIPTPEEMREVQGSSQIYREGEASIMTIRVLSVSSSPSPVLVAVTFILTPSKLVTLRYADPTPFKTFVQRAAHTGGQLDSNFRVMCGLLEAVVDRAAELLEGVGTTWPQSTTAYCYSAS